MNKKNIIVWLFLSLGYFVSRLINLGLIPIFTDEAIYLRWSQIMSNNFHYIYLPLTDGKPPLFMWVTAILMKILPNLNPLLAGRFISVIAGYLAMMGIYFTTRQLFKEKNIAFLAVLFYIFCPFTFFYDRFALADSMLAMFGVWSLGLGVVLVKTLKLKVALLLGIISGLGWLTKTPAEFFLALLPLSIIFFDFRQKNIIKKLLYLVFLYIFVVAIARAIYMLLFFLPQAYVINLKSYEFIIPFSEFIKHPFLFVLGNIHALSLWEVSYLTIPVVGLIFVSLFLGIFQKSLAKLILIIYFLSLFVFMCFFNKVIYPRFILMFTPMLLILAASGLWDVTKNKFALMGLAAIFLILPLKTDYLLVTDPVSAPIADNDSTQYINGWSAGWGVNEVNSFISQQAKSNPRVTVGTEGTFGLMPYALELYQSKNDNVSVKAYWPAPDELPAEIVLAAKQYPTYYLIYQRSSYPPSWRMQLVMQFRQGSSNSFLKLYKVE